MLGRKLTIGAIEPNAAFCQCIDVGRLNVFRAVAAKSTVQIVDRDEEHVGLFIGTLYQKGQRGDGKECKAMLHVTESFPPTPAQAILTFPEGGAAD